MIVITVARKPLEESTVATNTLKWGCGGLNIDGSRIACEGGSPSAQRRESECARLLAGGTPSHKYGGTSLNESKTLNTGTPSPADALGRWPANMILSQEAAQELDTQSGVTTSAAAGVTYGGNKPSNGIFNIPGIQRRIEHGDTGGASRFFKQIQEDDNPVTIG